MDEKTGLVPAEAGDKAPPTTDPGDVRQWCSGCQRWKYLVIHSCPGVPMRSGRADPGRPKSTRAVVVSGLANRLVTAAGVHVSAVLDAETPEDVDALAVKAVVAVLRELAAGETEYGCFHPERLRGLADSVEKGEVSDVE